jgi:hypothetical protein
MCLSSAICVRNVVRGKDKGSDLSRTGDGNFTQIELAAGCDVIRRSESRWLLRFIGRQKSLRALQLADRFRFGDRVSALKCFCSDFNKGGSYSGK